MYRSFSFLSRGPPGEGVPEKGKNYFKIALK
jgi:hypothetical protein